MSPYQLSSNISISQKVMFIFLQNSLDPSKGIGADNVIEPAFDLN